MTTAKSRQVRNDDTSLPPKRRDDLVENGSICKQRVQQHDRFAGAGFDDIKDSITQANGCHSSAFQ